MGADGWIDIYDAEKIDSNIEIKKLFTNCFNYYTQTIFNRRVYTCYFDTEGRSAKFNDDLNSNIFNDYLITTWQVWT